MLKTAKEISIIMFICLAAFVMVPAAAMAATFYVDGSNGNDSNPGTASSPWKTIGKANTTLQPGDTVLIKKGTYRQSIKPSRSGSSGRYITFSRYQNDEAVITGVGEAVDLRSRQYIVVDGLTIKDVSGHFVNMRGNSNRNIIKNCRMEGAGAYCGIELRDGANYNTISGNVMRGTSRGPSDHITLQEGANYNLIEGNDISDSQHVCIALRLGASNSVSWNVIRNNKVSNPLHKPFSIYKVTDHNLLENNIIANSKNNGDFNEPGMQFGSSNCIIRKNVFFGNQTAQGWGAYSDYTNMRCSGNRAYSNTHVGGNYGIRVDYDNSSLVAGNVVKNNIFCSIGKLDIKSLPSGNQVANNSSSQDDPQFVDSGARDFHLKSTSPMIDRGAFLTTTRSAGSGKIMPVADAKYFMDGWGIVKGDTIQLKGQTQVAGIVKVDYQNNTLTLDTALSWTSGQGVSLPYSGNSPDIGAYEYGMKTPSEPPETPETPGPSTPSFSRSLEAESMTLRSPMQVGTDANASGGKFISVSSGSNTTTPSAQATIDVQIPEAGTYYLWVLMQGPDGNSDAMYVGVDGVFDRVYPVKRGVYEWVRVESGESSGKYGFNLSAGKHTLQIGHGELNARADRLFLTDDPNENPSTAGANQLSPPVDLTISVTE